MLAYRVLPVLVLVSGFGDMVAITNFFGKLVLGFFLQMRRFFPVLLVLPLLASCGSPSGPSASDKIVVIKEKGNTEFNCTKQSVKMYANNNFGIKEGWYTIPEFRKATVAAGVNSMAVEMMLADLLSSTSAMCK